jgi:hypothetical protein
MHYLFYIRENEWFYLINQINNYTIRTEIKIISAVFKSDFMFTKNITNKYITVFVCIIKNDYLCKNIEKLHRVLYA